MKLSNADIKRFSGVELCNKLSIEMWDSDRSEWTEFADFVQTALFLIDFDRNEYGRYFFIS